MALSSTGTHVVLTTNHTVIALTEEKEIKLITRVEPVHGLGIGRIVATLETLGEAFPEISRSHTRLVSCDLTSSELAKHAQTVSPDAIATRPEDFQKGSEKIKGAGSSPIEAASLYRALSLVPPPG
jgi:hypothetical protein